MILKDFIEKFEVALCLDGSLPYKNYFLNFKKIIAADGAANKLYKQGIVPDVVIGDLDSVILKNFPRSKIIHIKEQETTDFQKALNYMHENAYSSFIVFGVAGGFLDHILGNLNIILQNECSFYADGLYGIVVTDKISLKLKTNTKISIFGFDAVVSTQGLKWNLKETKLDFPGQNSQSNRVAGENILIEVCKGKLLILVYEDLVIDKGI